MNIYAFLLHNKGSTFTTAWYLREGESRDKLGEFLKATSVRSTHQRMLQVIHHTVPRPMHGDTGSQRGNQSHKCDLCKALWITWGWHTSHDILLDWYRPRLGSHPAFITESVRSKGTYQAFWGVLIDLIIEVLGLIINPFDHFEGYLQVRVDIEKVKFIFNRIKKGEGQGKEKCHTKSMMSKESNERLKRDTQYVTFRQNEEEKVQGMGLKAV